MIYCACAIAQHLGCGQVAYRNLGNYYTMAGCELEMTTLEGGDGEAHELRQQAIALQETEASEDDCRAAAEEDTLARPSTQLVLGTTGAPDGDVQVRKQGRIATDDGRAHMARQTVRGRSQSEAGSLTLERLKKARQKRALSPLPRIVSVSSNPGAADDQHPEVDTQGEAESPTDSTESNAEDEKISTTSTCIAQVNVGPSGRPHISLWQVYIYDILIAYKNNNIIIIK